MWSSLLGTVKATGPATGHFLRNIGIAYVVSGALLSYGAANLALRWGAAVAAAGGFAVEKFQHFMPVTMHRYHARADMLHMARIGATLVEDCGPCALLSARGALADGVAREAVNAALAGSPPAGAPALASAFGRALAANAPEVGALGDAIEAAHGRAVRTELALTAATVRAYPALKRGLGYAQACSAVRLVV